MWKMSGFALNKWKKIFYSIKHMVQLRERTMLNYNKSESTHENWFIMHRIEKPQKYLSSKAS